MSNFYSSRKPKNIKQHNQKMVLSLLQLADEISISELSEKTNLSKTTISKMFADFCHAGILLSAGKGESSSDGGKKPELFALNPEYGYTIVLSIIQPDRIVCSLTGLLGRVRYSRTEELDPEAGYPALLSGILRAITQTLGETGVPTDQIMGIAVACNGIVNTNTGTLLYPTHEPWGTHLPLREDIRRGLAFPVDIFIDTAHRCLLYTSTRKFRESEREARERAGEVLKLVGLEKMSGEIAADMAYGQQKRLELARALVSEPKLCLLDEPAAGLNSKEAMAMMELIKKIRREKDITFILIEHNMEAMMSTADRIMVMDAGKKIAEDIPEVIKNDPRVVRVYLGEEASHAAENG